MKMFRRDPFLMFLISVGVLSLFLFLTFLNNPTCGAVCGCCPGYVQEGYAYDLYTLKLMKNYTMKRPTFCSYVGCAPEQRFLYIDLLAVSILSFSSAFINMKRLSKK